MAVIKWRFLKNHSVFIDAHHYPIPCSVKAIPVETREGSKNAMVPVFDMTHVFETLLPECDYRAFLPKRREDFSDKWWAKLESAAMDKALANRAAASEIANRLKNYRDQGVIEIESDDDGLLEDTAQISDAEQALLEKAAK